MACCTGERSGILIAGFVDIILVFLYCILRAATRNVCSILNWYLTVWCLGHLIGDIILIIGVSLRSSGLLIIWMVIGMVSIVCGSIAWIWLPLKCSDAFVWVYITQIRHKEEFIFYALFVWVLIFPFYYICLWIVVRNYQRHLVRMQNDQVLKQLLEK